MSLTEFTRCDDDCFMTSVAPSMLRLKAADAVWVATSLLHQRNPSRASFQVAEIVAEVRALELTDRDEGSIYVHANQHCVATRKPNPAKLKMLVETAGGERRLFREGDAFHHGRDGRIAPKASDLSEEYRGLLDWYQRWCAEPRHVGTRIDPLLALRGSGRALWANEHADAYLENLRREPA